MKTITLSIPDKLKGEMDSIDFINWSSVARSAFAEVIQDLMEMQMRRRVRGISEIPYWDVREVRPSVASKVVNSVEKTLKQGKKPVSHKELHKLLGLE
jgi:hypothetical protein